MRLVTEHDLNIISKSFRHKNQLIIQWERQMGEILQWVSDEKDARAYLQALTSKMSDEVDYLKHSSGKFLETNRALLMLN